MSDMLASRYPLKLRASLQMNIAVDSAIASQASDLHNLKTSLERGTSPRGTHSGASADDYLRLSNISKRATKSHMDLGDSLMMRAATSQVMLLTCKPQC